MQFSKQKVIAQMQCFVLSDHSRFVKPDHGINMLSRDQLVDMRGLARDANRDTVVVRYIQFMLFQQEFARDREATARETVQNSAEKNSDVVDCAWWFETEGKKFICFYLFLAQFEKREIKISEMAYQLGKSREFCSRTLTQARRIGVLNEENELPEEIHTSVEQGVLSFLNTQASLAFIRTAMVRVMMQSALVMESENAAEYKNLRDKSMEPESYTNFQGIDDVLGQALNLDTLKNAAE